MDDRTAAAGAVLDEDSTECVRRTYAFDANGRRTSLSTTSGSTTCGTGTTASKSYAYDSADRPTTGVNGSGTYTYDSFGRQTLIPAADAPDSSKGTISVGYFDTDAARSITQGSTSTVFGLDSTGRRQTQTTTTGSTTSTLTRHYSDDSDNPAWVESATGGGATAVTRFAESIGGDLSASITATGDTQIGLADLHGDVLTNLTIPATQATGTQCTGITGWSDYTEYGTPRDQTATTTVAGVVGYGWLGAKQRSTTDATAGLTLMGARLYNPPADSSPAPTPSPAAPTTRTPTPQTP